MINVFENLSNNFKNIFLGNGLKTSGDFMRKNSVVLNGFGSMDNQYMTMIYDLGLIFTIVFCVYIFYNIFFIKI